MKKPLLCKLGLHKYEIKDKVFPICKFCGKQHEVPGGMSGGESGF